MSDYPWDDCQHYRWTQQVRLSRADFRAWLDLGLLDAYCATLSTPPQFCQARFVQFLHADFTEDLAIIDVEAEGLLATDEVAWRAAFGAQQWKKNETQSKAVRQKTVIHRVVPHPGRFSDPSDHISCSLASAPPPWNWSWGESYVPFSEMEDIPGLGCHRSSVCR